MSLNRSNRLNQRNPMLKVQVKPPPPSGQIKQGSTSTQKPPDPKRPLKPQKAQSQSADMAKKRGNPGKISQITHPPITILINQGPPSFHPPRRLNHSQNQKTHNLLQEAHPEARETLANIPINTQPNIKTYQARFHLTPFLSSPPNNLKSL